MKRPGGNVKTPKTGKFSGKQRKLRENGRISSDRNFSKSREFSRFCRLNIPPWSGLGCFGYKLYGGLSEFMWWSKKMLSLGGPIKKKLLLNVLCLQNRITDMYHSVLVFLKYFFNQKLDQNSLISIFCRP